MNLDGQPFVINLVVWVCGATVVLMALLYAFEYWVRYRQPGQIDLYQATVLIDKGTGAIAWVYSPWLCRGTSKFR